MSDREPSGEALHPSGDGPDDASQNEDIETQDRSSDTEELTLEAEGSDDAPAPRTTGADTPPESAPQMDPDPDPQPEPGGPEGSVDESPPQVETTPSVNASAEPPAGGIQGYLDIAITRLREGKPVFGERLLVMGSGPLPSLGDAEGTMGLDERGQVVLLVAMRGVDEGAAAPIERELDGIAELTEDELSQLAEEPGGAMGLKQHHDELFASGEHVSPSSLNSGQRAILLLEEEPSVDTWEALLSQLGDRLAGVYVVEKEAAWTVTPEETGAVREEEQREAAATAPTAVSTSISTSPTATTSTTAAPASVAPDEEKPPSNAFWIAVVVVGVALAIFGLSKALLGPEDTTGTQGTGPDTVQSPVRDVAVGTSYDATHTQWIGQSHLLRASDGRLLALYRSEGGLRIVADRSNQGRQWREPSKVAGIVADSFSAAIDSNDNIHVAFHNGSTVAYATLQQNGTKWRETGELALDESSTSPVVDIAWDEAAGVAHVVWAKDAAEGQQPYWASVDTSGATPQLLESQALADPGASLTALVTIDVNDESNVLATYRRPNSLQGWFSRTAAPNADDPDVYNWADEEKVPTKEGIGAASVVIDQNGIAHMVLRDSTSFELDYFTKKPGSPWSAKDVVVDASSTEEIDFPSLSVDTGSRLVYVFFQTNQTQVGTEVHVAVHDPATGWEPPYAITEPSDIPDGAAFPTSIGTINGQPIVLWTKGGSAAAIQAARISAP